MPAALLLQTARGAMLGMRTVNFSGIQMGNRFLDRFGRLGGDILWIGMGAAIILVGLVLILPRA